MRTSTPNNQAFDGTLDPHAALSGKVRRPRRSPLYLIGTALVAVAMVILPLLYLAFLLTVGFAVMAHAMQNADILETARGYQFRLLAYFGPLVMGIIAMAFLVKPLFMRPHHEPDLVELTRDEQPLFFAYVERLARILGAPPPKRIRVDGAVNASASFRRGLVSFTGNDLVLTVGTPLLTGLTLCQLTGVLAHELGHFTQGGGMRLSYVIRSVNHWFARVVYERDGFDQALWEMSQGGHIALMLVMNLSRLFIWLSRRILWLLMQAGLFISSLLLRQMEFDADRCGALVVGSEVFAGTTRRLCELNLGAQIVNQDISHFSQRNMFPESIGELTVVAVSKIEAAHLEKDWAANLGERTHRLATHPSDVDRIEHVERFATPGILHQDGPADCLLNDLEEIDRTVTLAAYVQFFGVEPSADQVIPVSVFLARKEHAQEAVGARERFFQGTLSHDRVVFPGLIELDQPLDRTVATARLQEIRRDLIAAIERGEDPDLRADGERLALALRVFAMADGSITGTDCQGGPTYSDVEALLDDLVSLEPFILISAAIVVHLKKIDQVMEGHQGVLPYSMTEVVHEEVRQIGKHLKKMVSLVASGDIESVGVTEGIGRFGEQAAELLPTDDFGSVFDLGNAFQYHVLNLGSGILAGLAYAAELGEAMVGLDPMPEPPHPTGRSGNGNRMTTAVGTGG